MFTDCDCGWWGASCSRPDQGQREWTEPLPAPATPRPIEVSPSPPPQIVQPEIGTIHTVTVLETHPASCSYAPERCFMQQKLLPVWRPMFLTLMITILDDSAHDSYQLTANSSIPQVESCKGDQSLCFKWHWSILKVGLVISFWSILYWFARNPDWVNKELTFEVCIFKLWLARATF